MYKALLALLILCTVCWVIQLLPVISVPLTSHKGNIYLSHFENIKFGVFGICDTQTGRCSSPKIGYPSSNSSFSDLDNDVGTEYSGVVLPSYVRYTISKLLVVHVVAFCFSSLLLIVIALLYALKTWDRIKDRSERRSQTNVLGHLRNERREGNEDHIKSDDEDGANMDTIETNIKERDLSPYLNAMLFLTIFSVLTTLLAFLADILLFVPRLSYLGWIQLLPIVSMALITSMLCFIKRSISSRKFFETYDHPYANEEMKILRNRAMDQTWDDSSSDDGFVVYTDGFYTRNEGEGDDARDRAHSAGSIRSGILHNDDRRSEDYSVNSSGESIELDNPRLR
ncbi:RIM9 [Candida theae]|uniref:RIM9 n=1 Tax=Candida theae TaxID=1198502 RepID=A0AAD5BHZ8_9ASCO|nr:RIM9 [Candida theae]KAI5964548.1 RIM9 [Candida theae]